MSDLLETSVHHHCPTSRGGSEAFINKERKKEKYHTAHHLLFGNCVPHEQIAQIVLENRDVLKPEFVEAMVKLLGIDGEEMYEREAFTSDAAIRKLQVEQKGALRKLLASVELQDAEPIFVIKFPALDYSRRPA
jgi:hypothetical protein